jgi:excinuclease UvrABC helicase subunit UvrB
MFFNVNDLFNHLFNFDRNDYIRKEWTPEKEGEFKIESGEDENGKWERKSWKSTDGTSSYVSYMKVSSPKQIETEEELKKQLQEAVEKQEFERAAKLRDKISHLKSK